MGEILDKTKYKKEIASIGRRDKKEFIIVPIEIWEEKGIGDFFQEEIEESNLAFEQYIKNTPKDDIDWKSYIIKN